MIIELNREEELRKQNKLISDAIALFEFFIKKYTRRKKLKKAHLLKNKMGKYSGEIIFIDMICSNPYTEEEKELLFQCLISMPLKNLYNFEQLYIKLIRNRLKNDMENIENDINNKKEELSLNIMAEVFFNELKIKIDNIIYYKEKLAKMEKKHGKHTDIYKELDKIFEYRNENIRGFKKQTILSLINKYFLVENYPNLSNEELENFKSRLYNTIKAGYKNYRDNLQ